MELRQLRYFVGIVDAGSMTQAALRLRVAQPALSQQIGRLEAELDAELLHRGARGVVPTEAGSALYRHAEVMLSLADETHEAVRRARETVSGHVRLGMSSYLSHLLATALVNRLQIHSPGVTLEIHEHFAVDQTLQLQGDEVDVSLVSDEGPLDDGVTLEPLFTETFVFVRRRDPAAAPLPPAMSVADAVQQPLVVSSSSRYRAKLEQPLEGTGLQLRPVAEAKSALVMMELVRSGTAAAIVPPSCLRLHRDDGGLESCATTPAIRRPVSFAYTHVFPMTKATRAVCDALVDLLREQIDSGLWIGATLDHSPAP